MANNSNEEPSADGEGASTEELALAFASKRHTEIIEGVNAITQTWRMKERV